jgi:hypothetical protein
MFGSSALGGFALSEEDRQYGRYTLGALIDAVNRSMAAGRFRPDDARLVAQQLWIALHGLVTLDLGGYLAEPYDADVCFENQMRILMVGAGDDNEAVLNSLADARSRYLMATGRAPSVPALPGER